MTENNKADFGTKLNELQAITEWFESDKIDLNASLAKFERGMQLAEELKGELQQVENRVEAIKQRFDQPLPGESGLVASGDDGDPDED